MLLYVEATSWEQAYVPTRLRLIETMMTAMPVDATGALPARASQADVVSVAGRSRVDRPLLDRLPRLRLLLVRSGAAAGVDLEACRECGVAVRVVGGDSEYVAAEHTFARLLALSHRLGSALGDGYAGPPREPGTAPPSTGWNRTSGAPCWGRRTAGKRPPWPRPRGRSPMWWSVYDHVLDAIALVGAVPPRFAWNGDDGRPGRRGRPRTQGMSAESFS